MNDNISVLLVDDHAMVREMLGRMLQAEPDMEVSGIVKDAEEAVARAVELRPAVIIWDIDMPGLSSFEAVRMVRERCPGTRSIFLSAFFHDRYIEQALSIEAAGYVTKTEPLESVISAIRAVAAGGIYFSPEVQSRIVIDSTGARLAQQGTSRLSLLTAREIDILRYLARGMSTKEVARVVHISNRTVDRHRENIMAKLDIHDRVELARFAIREGLTEA